MVQQERAPSQQGSSRAAQPDSQQQGRKDWILGFPWD
jgi:hypothetical protein